MNWGEFIRYNRWQKLGALLFAVLIWLTAHRRVRNGNLAPTAYSGDFNGDRRVVEDVPVHLITQDQSTPPWEAIPNRVTVTARGPSAALSQLSVQQIRAIVAMDRLPAQETRALVEVYANGFELDVAPKEVLIRPRSAVSNSP